MGEAGAEEVAAVWDDNWDEDLQADEFTAQLKFDHRLPPCRRYGAGFDRAELEKANQNAAKS